MKSKKSCIAIIPARSGSKRIKNKNIKKFFNKPIIYYPIKTALKSKCFDEVHVSTNSKKIANLATQFGAKVPILRPKKLSKDNSSTISVINHYIKYLNKEKKKFDFVCCIYPTSVFVKAKHIISAYKKLKNKKLSYVFTVSQFPQPIERSFTIKKSKVYQPMKKKYILSRSNYLKKKYFDAGQFYFGKTSSFKKNKLVFSRGSGVIEIDKYKSIDINDNKDWEIAKTIFKKLKF